MANKLQILRNITTPATDPSSLLEGELAINLAANPPHLMVGDVGGAGVLNVGPVLYAAPTPTVGDSRNGAIWIDSTNHELNFNSGGVWRVAGGSSITDNADGTYDYDTASPPSIIDTRASSNPYDNSGSGLTATDVNAAIDEVLGEVPYELDDLLDVELTSPANNSVMIFDTSGSPDLWVDTVLNLDTAADVTISGPSNGEVLTYNAGTWGNAPASLSITLKTVSGATYTFATADNGYYIRFTNNGGTVACTIPLHSSDPMPVGTSINMIQAGTSTVEIDGPAGSPTVLINSASGLTDIRGQYGVVTILKVDDDEWDIMGDVAI